MDKIAGILLISLLAIVFTVSLSYYISTQSSQNNFPNPTPTPSPEPTPTQSPSEEPTEPASITKPSVPEFTLEYVDNSYYVPSTYEIDQYTGENVTVTKGYYVDNKAIEVTIKNQQFTPYTDSNGNDINLYYNFRFKGNYGDEWTYYPEDSNGWTVIHYGGGIQVDDTKMYPPFYTASNSDCTVVSLGLRLLGPPVGSQVIPDDTEVNFQTQALIGYFERNEHGYYILTGESSDWSSTQTITIP